APEGSGRPLGRRPPRRPARRRPVRGPLGHDPPAPRRRPPSAVPPRAGVGRDAPLRHAGRDDRLIEPEEGDGVAALRRPLRGSKDPGYDDLLAMVSLVDMENGGAEVNAWSHRKGSTASDSPCRGVT